MDREQNHREAQAEAEVGQTAVRPVVAAFMVLFFVLVVLTPLLWDSAHHVAGNSAFHVLDEARHLPPRSTEISRTLWEAGLLQGTAQLNTRMRRRMESFESRLQSTSSLRIHLVTPVNRFFSGLLGASNADVYPGRTGWLFYGPALRHVTGPPFLRAHQRFEGGRAMDSVAAILGFQRQLAERDIILVLLPLPGKVSIYPEQLSTTFDGKIAVQNVANAEFLRQVRDAGVLVCDVVPTLMDAKERTITYLRRDSHWSPLGMERCAEVLAAFIGEHVSLPPDNQRSYRRGEGREVAYRGDLATMLYPEANAEGEMDETVFTHPIFDSEGGTWAPHEESAVLLLGDSFTNIYSQADLGWGTGAGLAEQLSFYLQRPVDRIAQNDHGAFASRQILSDTMHRGRDRLANTRVLVYEFAARELSWGDWKGDLPMQLGSTIQAPAALEDAITVSGRILKRSLPPVPGSVPYKDCIVSILIESIERGSEPSKSFLIYAWGMRDHQWTDVTSWQVGERVRLDLQRWSLVNETLGSINRVPLDDGVMNAEPWWLTTEATRVETPLSATATLPKTTSVPDDIGLIDLVQQLEAAKQQVLRGQDGWLFFTPELRSMSVGPFWGEAAPQVSRARNKDHADPRVAILDFNRQLKGAGIELILMPVPPKAGIYAEKVGGARITEELRASMESDGALGTFLAQLAVAGITVIDLQAAFEAQADAGAEPFYCRTDTHWSPRACSMAADSVAERIRTLPWYDALPKNTYETRESELVLHGDLAALIDGETREEIISLKQVGVAENGTFTPLLSARQSPVLLIGDSHNLVFHGGGDMHATAAGLPDLLAHALGFPVDLVAVRGSGATTPRITLARRRDKLAGKKVVVWCFAAREFTESTTGWRVIPVIP